jgi:hypothetical protein
VDHVLLQRLEDEFFDHDCSTLGFESIRAQDILPSCSSVFIPVSSLVPAASSMFSSTVDLAMVLRRTTNMIETDNLRRQPERNFAGRRRRQAHDHAGPSQENVVPGAVLQVAIGRVLRTLGGACLD